jgi:hypothetical protein
VSWNNPFKIPAPVVGWRREAVAPRGRVRRLAAHGRVGGRLAADRGEGGGREEVRTRGHHPLLTLGPLPVALVAPLRLHTFNYELLTAMDQITIKTPDTKCRLYRQRLTTERMLGVRGRGERCSLSLLTYRQSRTPKRMRGVRGREERCSLTVRAGLRGECAV